VALTPAGMPFPVGTDAVRDGDNAIQALAEAVYPGPVGSRYGLARRTGSGAFGSGSFATLATLAVPNAPAGIWRTSYMFKISNSGNTTVYLRGMFNGENVTADEQVQVVAGIIDMFTIDVIREVPAGGVASLGIQLLMQVATGTGTAPAGSRITTTWEGPA
jgi:hypothetical protein